MKKSPLTAWRANISLSWDQPQPTAAGPVATPEELGEKITSLTEVLLLARGGGATFESEHSIVIQLDAPNVPDLTVIDLPGIVRTQVVGQGSTVIADVNNLLDRYLKQERTIILAVIPSNVDIATVDILERANNADPEGVRTIGVLTKPDTIGEGNEEEVMHVVLGLRKPLKLGYLMVKNRSQKQIDEGLTLMDARSLETTFFSAHPQFGSANASYFGVENLMSRLTSVLVQRIQEGLPAMRKEISDLREKTHLELSELGKPPPTEPTEIRQALHALSQDVHSIIGEAEQGNYTNVIFVADKLRMMARIRRADGPQETFRKSVLGLKPTAEWEVTSLRASIAGMRGRELPGFLNWKVVSMLIKTAVIKWKEPALGLLQDTKLIVEEVCDEIVDAIVPQYRMLAASMKQIVSTIVDERAEFIRDTIIDQWVQTESIAFTLQPEFYELYNKKKVERFSQAYDEMAPGLMKMWGKGQGQDSGDGAKAKLVEWYKQTHSVGDLSNDHHEAEDMQMLLESYWKTAVDRAIDSICMKVDSHLIQGLASKVLTKLIGVSLDEGKSAAFFAQDPRTREKRSALQARLERLNKAQALISASV
jgi:interferon-induced GTP-binding protein Mx1